MSLYERLFNLDLDEKDGRFLILELKKELPEISIPKKVLNFYGFLKKNKSKLYHPRKIYEKGVLVFDPTKYWNENLGQYTQQPKIGDEVLVKPSRSDLQKGIDKFYLGKVIEIGSYRGKSRFYIRPDFNHKVVIRFQTQIQLL